MAVPRLPATCTGRDVSDALAAGCAIVERLVPAAVLDGLRDELRPWLDATPTGPDDFAGRRTRRPGGLVVRSPRVRALPRHPLVLDAVGAHHDDMRDPLDALRDSAAVAALGDPGSASARVRGA